MRFISLALALLISLIIVLSLLDTEEISPLWIEPQTNSLTKSRAYLNSDLSPILYQVLLNQSPVGYLMIEHQHDSILARRHLKLKRGTQWVEQQLEFIFTYSSSTYSSALSPIISPRTFLNSPTYEIKWRQFTHAYDYGWRGLKARLENGVRRQFGKLLASLIGSPPSMQLSTGITQVTHRGTQWCLTQTISGPSHSQSKLHSQIKLHSSKPHSLCSDYILIPDLLWPWLTDQFLQSPHSSPQKIVLFDPVMGTVIEENLTIHFPRSSRQFIRVGDYSEAYHVQTKKNTRRITRVESGRNPKLKWSLEHTYWHGWKTHTQGSKTALDMLEQITIQGEVAWRSVSQVTLKITSPLVPISSPRQRISSLTHDDSSITKDTTTHLLLKVYRQAPLELLCIHPVSQEPVLIQLPSLDDLSERQYAAFSGLWARLRGLSSLSKIKLEELLRESTMWVQQTISFEPHAGFPDPLLALERGRGDCNERSAALALILSSFGLRVEQVFGLLWLRDKRWGLHAWVRVFTPWGWIELDPSMRSLATQTRIGPEHIALTSGEGAAQSDLSLIFGRWEAEISQ